MSETPEPKVDFAKVTQMLDTGWIVSIAKQGRAYMAQANRGTVEEDCMGLTPESTLTKLAYQVRGEKP